MGKNEDDLELKQVLDYRELSALLRSCNMKEMTTEEMAGELSKACDVSSGIAYVNTALDIIQNMRRRPRTVLGKIHWILRDIWFAIR